MDNRLSLVLWTLAGGFSFALVGGLFGGLASWLSWRGGNASGSIVGRRVADALARLLGVGRRAHRSGRGRRHRGRRPHQPCPAVRRRLMRRASLTLFFARPVLE